MAKVSRDEEVDENDRQRKERADQAFGQPPERAADVEAKGGRQRWRAFAQRFPEKIHREREPEAEDDIGKKNAGKAEDAAGGQQGDCSVKAGLRRCEEAPAEREDDEKQRQRIESKRKACRPEMLAEDAEAGSG